MKNLPKEKRDRIVLTVLGTLAITVGLYYGLITNQLKSLETTAKKKSDQEDKLSRAQHLIEGRNQTEKNLAQASAQLRAIEDTMASGDMYSWVIQTVNTFRKGYEVDIPQFSREVSTSVGMFPEFPYRAAAFHLRGTAKYRDFGKFLADFENSFPYIRVQNIELEPLSANTPSTGGGAATETKERLSFKMEIVTLVKP